jgi:hypothetical protein
MNQNITQSTAERLHYIFGLGLFINNHAISEAIILAMKTATAWVQKQH